LFSFLIVAFALFMVVKGMNELRRKQEEEHRHRAATFTRGGAASGDQACARQRLRWRHWTGLAKTA